MDSLCEGLRGETLLQCNGVTNTNKRPIPWNLTRLARLYNVSNQPTNQYKQRNKQTSTQRTLVVAHRLLRGERLVHAGLVELVRLVEDRVHVPRRLKGAAKQTTH